MERTGTTEKRAAMRALWSVMDMLSTPTFFDERFAVAYDALLAAAIEEDQR